ncbi:hypothetical protein ACJRO7_021855 [Eucalyptus globulus]|uniref:Uncharacterized protein n=1 Tax=Eucalyptus globulus TaxID=34317 RepID=A0ABD3KSU3_EUCGL
MERLVVAGAVTRREQQVARVSVMGCNSAGSRRSRGRFNVVVQRLPGLRSKELVGTPLQDPSGREIAGLARHGSAATLRGGRSDGCWLPWRSSLIMVSDVTERGID